MLLVIPSVLQASYDAWKAAEDHRKKVELDRKVKIRNDLERQVSGNVRLVCY